MEKKIVLLYLFVQYCSPNFMQILGYEQNRCVILVIPFLGVIPSIFVEKKMNLKLAKANL